MLLTSHGQHLLIFVELKDKWKDKELSLLCYPNHAHFADRYFGAVKNTMTFMDEHVGEYPYERLTIVDVPIHGLYTGGMEYPMLISSFSLCFFPKKIRTPEILAAHEFIHQYFMQLVATNETEDPWMDEGITTYYECRMIDNYYGEKEAAIDVAGIKCGNTEYNRYELIKAKDTYVAPGKYKSWEYPGRSYGNVAYNKMGSILNTLEALMETEHFDACMKLYFESWKFRHPGPKDFVDIFNKYALNNLSEKFPNGLDNYFEQTLFNDRNCDYSVQGFSSRKSIGRNGIYNIEEPCISEASSNSDVFVNEIYLRRDGSISLPVELKMSFEDGTNKTMIWENKLFEKKIQFESNSKMISAVLDPDFKIDLDYNRINNGKRVPQASVNASKYGKRIQSILQFALEGLSSLFL